MTGAFRLTSNNLPSLATVLTLALFTASPAFSQDPPVEDEMTYEEMLEAELKEIETFGWERDEVGKIGTMAEIKIPEGYRFTGKFGTEKLMEYYGNPLTEKEMGTIGPEDLNWCVVFEFDKSGYVKDDEKDEIDDAAILKVFKEGQEADNKRRKQLGMETLKLVGWAKKPFYNEETNNLEWALDLRTEDGESVINYRTKLLGRYGVMESTLICGGDQLTAVLPIYQGLLEGYAYSEGNTYAEFRSGDKVAEYGLTALIVGGAGFAAAKLGLFAVIGKLLAKFWYLVVAAAVGLKAFISRIFGGGKKSEFRMDQ